MTETTKGLGYLDKEFFTIKYGLDAISESIMKIMMTNPGERVGRPYFGVGLSRRLFEPLDQVSMDEIEMSIAEQIETYEPRAEITSINVIQEAELSLIRIKIGFREKGDVTGEERFIQQDFNIEE